MSENQQPETSNKILCFFLPALVFLAATFLSFSTWRNENILRCSYNGNRLLTHKVSWHEIVDLEYDESCNKINLVKRRERKLFSRPAVSRYEYNNQCLLVKAAGPEGDVILLDYDEQGNISHIEIEGEPSVKLFYAESGRLKGVTLEGQAPAAIMFDKEGEMDRLAGIDYDTTVTISRTLKKLLNIVGQANVDLKF